MPKRDESLLIKDMQIALERVVSYVSNMDLDAFLADQKTIDAVTRNLEIVGEAARQMDESMKSRYPDIPWHRIVGLRHRIVHDYFGVDVSLIWTIASKDALELSAILTKSCPK